MRPSTSFLRALRLFAFAPAALLSAAAAVWVDPNWALVGEVRPVVVYDTNLNARNENLEDVYAALTPKLTLSRRGSATRIEIDAQVERTWFRDLTEFNSTDPQANLLYEFPVREGGDPTSHVELHWALDSATNTDLGRRTRSESLRGRWDQRVLDTGRTVLDLRLDGRSLDYRDADLNTNEAIALEARIGYTVTPQARLGIGYGHEWTRSLGVLGRGDTDGDEDRVFVRASGELLPKLNGSLETGVAFVSYTGAVTRDDTAWIAAASLQWEPTPEAVATVRASRYTDFSPEGSTALRSELLIDLTRRVGRGFSVRGGGGIARVSTIVDSFEEHANAVILTAAVAYQLTDRFSAELSERWTRQEATRDTLDYERHLVTGQVAFLF
jgi:hypothetical protein